MQQHGTGIRKELLAVKAHIQQPVFFRFRFDMREIQQETLLRLVQFDTLFGLKQGSPLHIQHGDAIQHQVGQVGLETLLRVMPEHNAVLGELGEDALGELVKIHSGQTGQQSRQKL